MAKKSKVKGKSPKGRALQKTKAQKQSANATASLMRSSAWPRAMNGDDDEDDGGDSYMGFRGFKNARTRDSAPHTPSFKLRHQTVSFVSAGVNASTIPQPTPRSDSDADEDEHDDVEEDITAEEVEHVAIQIDTLIEKDMQTSENAMANMNLDGSTDIYESRAEERSVQASAMSEDNLFVVDTMGDTKLAQPRRSSGRSPLRRTPSPAPSDSSEEVVVFHGRNRAIVVDDPISSVATTSQYSVKTPSSTPQPQVEHQHPIGQKQVEVEISAPTHALSASSHQPEDLLSALEASLSADRLAAEKSYAGSEREPPTATQQSQSNTSGWASQASKHDLTVDSGPIWAPAPAGSWWKKGKTAPVHAPSLQTQAAEATIAQLQADWKQVLREKRQVKQNEGESETIKPDQPKSNRRGKRGRKKDNRTLRDHASSDDEEFDAAFEDYINNMIEQEDPDLDIDEKTAAFLSQHPLGQVDLQGGPSIVIDGKAIDDDELLNEAMSVTDEDDDLSDDDDIDVQELGDESGLADEIPSGLDSSDLEDELEYTEEQQWQDEADLRQRRIDQMSDEQLARLFAKQQELGIDDDELILEDGLMDDLDGIGDIDAARAGLASMTNLDFASGSSKRRRARRGEPTFADASLMADIVEQYGENGFDIMDFDRPSLRQTKKGRKGKLPPELEALSDDELRDSMAQAWANDRGKKAQRKAEREELRVQGLLGSKTGAPDLRIKYATGITMAQVQEELRLFLANDSQPAISFPPMDKHDRKDLHQVANILKLKSKSIGGGNTRFPVLTKTPHTRFSQPLLREAFAAASRGFLGSRKALKKAASANRPGHGGGFSKAATGLRNGEVVGAGAAEIGKENFGHRMMEKMGWSKGQALGKEGEGRLIPVEQVMRSGRAGLG